MPPGRDPHPLRGPPAVHLDDCRMTTLSTSPRPLLTQGARIACRIAAALAAALLLAPSAHAQTRISALEPTPAIVPAGGEVTNRIAVAELNGTPVSAPGTGFTFAFPAGAVYRGPAGLPAGVSCNATVPQGSPGPGSVRCTGITLAANQTVDVNLVLGTVAQGSVSVTATIEGGGSSETKTITVNQGADIGVSMNAPASAPSGSTQPVVFTLTNAGPDASTGSRLTYPIPTGFSVASTGLPSGCSIAGGTLACSVGPLAVGGSTAITIQGVVTAASGSTVAHQAAVAPASGAVGDGVASNNTAGRVTNVTAGNVLTLSKTHDGGQILVGQRFGFTLAPRFSGTAPTGVTLTDTVPANFAIESPLAVAAGWTCNVAGQTISCARTDIGGAGGAGVSLGDIVIPVRAIGAGTGIVNQATLAATGPVSGSVSAQVPADVAPSDTDFRADKRRGWPQNNVPLNQPFNFTVGATNLGSTRLLAGSTVALVDNLPANMRLNSITPNGFTCTVTKGGAAVALPVDGPADVNCSRVTTADIPVDLSSGGSGRNAGFVTLNVAITSLPVPAGTQVRNRMCVNVALPSGGDPDANPGNDCSDVDTGVDGSATAADVRVNKRVVSVLGASAGSPQVAGSPVTWEIEIVNAGPSAAQNVAISDTFVQVSGTPTVQTVANGGTFAAGCSIGAPAGNGNVSLAGCRLTDLPVCRPAYAPVSADPLCPVVRVTAAHYGDGGSANDHTFRIVNKASAVAATPADPVLDDAGNTNSGSATAHFTALTDMTVTKNASPGTVRAGQLLTYTLAAVNRIATPDGGFSRAYAVEVVDTLPNGLMFLSAIANGGGVCNTAPSTTAPTDAGNNQLRCTWGSIGRSQQQTVTVRVRPLAAMANTALTNNVTVATATPESLASNNTASATANVTVPDYDLVAAKTDDVDPVNVGDNVTYTLQVSNNRPSTAEGIRVVDTLPVTVPGGEAAPTLVGVTVPSGVTYSFQNGAAIGAAGGQIVFTVNRLGGSGPNATGESNSVSFQVQLQGAGKGSFVNRMEVGFLDSSQDAFDALPGNNVVSESTAFRYKADVQVVGKQAVASGTTTPLSTVSTGQTFDWLVTVRNNGPDAAETTEFRDALSSNLVVAGVPSLVVTAGAFTPAAPGCSVAGNVVTCAIASMPANGAATVRIPVRFANGSTPANGTVVTNTASIVTTGSGDTNGGASRTQGNNFGSGQITVQNAAISGRVYEDLNGSGQPDSGEPAIAGVTLTLTGADAATGTPTTLTTTTDANGFWSFIVSPGTYTVTQTQPAGYLPGVTRAGAGSGSTPGTVPPGTRNGPNGSNANVIQGIVLTAGGSSQNNFFGEVRGASIAGRVYQDVDYSNGFTAADRGIPAATVAINGTDMFGNTVSLPAATTDANGAYSFTGLVPGTYGLVETQPAGYADGPDDAGSAGGVVANDQVSAIALRSNVNATGYDFGEVLTRISVRVFVDQNNDGIPQAGDTGIAGVVVRLTGTDAAGNPVDLLAVSTGPVGSYEFRNVPPSGGSGYTITETQPAAYAPGKAQANGQPGNVQSNGNVVTGVTVSSNAPPLVQGSYDFGELLPSGISGRVFYDRDGNGIQGAPATEPGLAGVTVALSGSDDQGNVVSLTTQTDAAGDYRFQNLAPGSYTVVETRPSGYEPGLTRAGPATGAGSAPGTVPNSGAGVSVGPNGSNANSITGIRLGSAGAGSAANNFSAVRPASLSGHVYFDLNPANGVRDSGEPGIAGASVTVSGTDFFGNAVTQVLVTDADGRYGTTTLRPGVYQIDEAQPANVSDGGESVGLVSGVPRGTANPGAVNDRIGGISLVSEEAGVGYDFGERGGQIGGWVYVDSNNDGIRQPGEGGIAGVSLRLTGRSAGGLPVDLAATTDARGRYAFTGLLPADASGYTVRETQPATYADGLDAVGTLDGTASGTLGNDLITAIAFISGNGDNYNFGERAASLAGTVWNDANGNGVREPQDLPIAGVTITLTGTDASGSAVTRTAITDANGAYRFVDLPLPDGNGYTLTETQPTGYDEGGARAGTLGGTVQGTNVIRVPLTAAAIDGTGYDFSERNSQPGLLSGRVWLDANHNRSKDGGEGLGEGWTVELLRCSDGGNACADSALQPLYSVLTGADGGYLFGDLTPGEYRVRFRTPDGRLVGGTWPTDPVQNGASGPYPTPAASDPRLSIRVRIAAGVHTVQQDLPYDPGGVVYDSVSGAPVPGATVTLVGPAGFDPARHLLDGRGSYTTGTGGSYDFFLLPGAPAGSYQLTVVPPGAYQPSSVFPPAGGALGTQGCTAPAGGPVPAQSNPCVISPGGALVPGAGYYMSFLTPAGGGQRVVANNIPLDPADTSVIELRKTTPKLTVKKGELLPYRITARNTRSAVLNSVAVVDTLPPGFRFIAGSLTVRTLPGGVALPVVPQINGRQLVVPGQQFNGNETKEYQMVAGVGVGVGEGEYVNQVIAQQGIGGRAVSNLASASVRVIPDALFDCTDVIGTVYDDKNANGYQDEGEPGLANVRVATVNGLLVTTDAEGRYHIACAAIPKEGTGSNLVLKVDERTLPSGYRTTSENPAAERATRGKVLKVNFGATVHRVVRLAIQSSAFAEGGVVLQPVYTEQVAKALTALAEKPAVLRLAYRSAAGEPASLAERRTEAVKSDVLIRWQQLGRDRAERGEPPLFNLDVEVERLPAAGKP